MRSRLLNSIALLFLFTSNGYLWSQGEFGVIVGISNYQGDLSSYNTQGGFKAKINPVLGFHGGYELSPKFQLRGDLLYTRLAGDDKLNKAETSRQRNLNFFSPILQLAGGLDWNIFGFSATDGNTFTPYVSGGASIFYMNPMTRYEGKKIALHPLGTEGQYLSDFPNQKPYSLFQPSVQFGGGLKMLISHNIVLALEAMLSYTFTDYIDDVSTIYITYPELLAKAGPLTAALANRQGEYFNTGPVIVPTGSLRGHAKTKDYFGIITLRVSIPVEIGRSIFKARHGHSKTIRCPTF